MPPYLLLMTNDGKINDISGYVGEIWKIIEKRLEIRYNYIYFHSSILSND